MLLSKTAIIDPSFLRACPSDGRWIAELVDGGYIPVITDSAVYELCTSDNLTRWTSTALKLQPSADVVCVWHHTSHQMRSEFSRGQPFGYPLDEQFTNVVRRQLANDPTRLPKDIDEIVNEQRIVRDSDSPNAAFASFAVFEPLFGLPIKQNINGLPLDAVSEFCRNFVQDPTNTARIVDMMEDLPNSDVVNDEWITWHTYRCHLAIFCDYLRAGSPSISTLGSGAQRRWVNRFHDLDYVTLLSKADAIVSQETSGEQRWYRDWVYSDTREHVCFDVTRNRLAPVG